MSDRRSGGRRSWAKAATFLFLRPLLVKDKAKKKLHGIPFRIAETWKDYFTYTTVETSGVKCYPPLYVRTLDNVPSSDFYTIVYKTDWFEKTKFGVTLNANGTLASVSVESTPVSPKDLAEIAQIVAGLPMFLPSLPETDSQAELMPSPTLPHCTENPEPLGRCRIGDEGCEKEIQTRMEELRRGGAIE